MPCKHLVACKALVLTLGSLRMLTKQDSDGYKWKAHGSCRTVTELSKVWR